MKKILAFTIVFVLCANVGVFASRNRPLERMGSGLDDMVYGKVETPDSIDETGTKGEPAYPDCTHMTEDGVGRGIARFVGGLWKVATFWYPEDDCDTK